MALFVRLGAGLSAIGALLIAALAGWQRSMLGFPDGALGPADALLDPLFLGITIASVGLAGGLAALAVARLGVRARAAGTLLLVTLGLLLGALSLSAEPVLRGLYPSAGG